MRSSERIPCHNFYFTHKSNTNHDNCTNKQHPPAKSVRNVEYNAISLITLSEGESAYITNVKLPASISLRFAEMGFCSGTKVTVIRKAPLGDPLEVELKNYRICLRGSEAKSIFVNTSEVPNE